MKFTLVLVSALFLVSCDKDKSKKPEPEEFGVPALNGQWTSDCLQNSTLYSGPLGEKRVIRIEGPQLITKHLLFKDEKCSDSQVQLTFVKRSMAKFTDLSSNKEKTGFYEIDDTVNSFSIIPANAEYADILTRTEFCKYKKWIAGKEYDVTAKRCGDLFPATTKYTILKYDDSTTPDTFTLGKFTNNENGSTPQSRPKTLAGDLHTRVSF